MDSAALAALLVTFAPRAWGGGREETLRSFPMEEGRPAASHVCLRECVYLVRASPGCPTAWACPGGHLVVLR